MPSVDEFPCNAAVTLPGPVGALEALTACPDADRTPAATVVICHPHPLLGGGGTMHNKVVHTLARAFGDMGLRTLRLNFRGVGASTGTFDHGDGETEDVLAVLDWVRARRPRDDIWLAGFSFGGIVAARAALRAEVKQLVTVAPAVHLYDFRSLPRPDVPWLVIQGDEDDVVAAEAVRQWAGQQQPPVDLVVLEGVGHYFHGKLTELKQVVTSRLS